MCALCMQAVQDGKHDFLEGDACSDLDHHGFAALHYAVMYHKVDTIKKLLPKCSKLLLLYFKYTYTSKQLPIEPDRSRCIYAHR